MDKSIPKHIAIIMDGNRRWAKERGLGESKGHAQGVENVEKIVEAAIKNGVKTVTVYALSTENLHERPKSEIRALFELLKYGVKKKLPKLIKNGVKVEIIGETSGIPLFIKRIISDVNKGNIDKPRLKLNIAFNYGGKREIVFAIQRIIKDGIKAEEVSEDMISARLYSPNSDDPDLVIRTGGKARLSNFLLWQTAYSELYFSEKLWPDFNEDDLQKAIIWFSGQKRNFGK